MTDEDRKFLTEQMGECWHAISHYSQSRTLTEMVLPCTKCGKLFGIQDLFSVARGNRTFTTWTDFGAVWEWATGQEWFESFLLWGHDKWIFDETALEATYTGQLHWLIDLTRFPALVVEFLRERTGK